MARVLIVGLWSWRNARGPPRASPISSPPIMDSWLAFLLARCVSGLFSTVFPCSSFVGFSTVFPCSSFVGSGVNLALQVRIGEASQNRQSSF